MSFIRRALIIGLASIVLSLGTFSCGSANSNDQGTSFLGLGWFIVDPVTNEIVPTSGATTELFFDNAFGSIEANELVRLMGVENRLATQFLRVTRVECSYDIGGADVAIPNDSYTFSYVLGPAVFDAESSPENAIVPTGPRPNDAITEEEEAFRAQVVFMGVPLVTTDIFAFLNANQNNLPQLPFDMTVTCTAIAISQAGDTFETNPVSYNVLFVERTECCTSSFQNGSGTGGDFDSFDSSASSSSSAADNIISPDEDSDSSIASDEVGLDDSGNDFIF